MIQKTQKSNSNIFVYCVIITIYFFDQVFQLYVNRVSGVLIFFFISYFFFRTKNDPELNNFFYFFVIIFTVYNILSFSLNIDKCDNFTRIISSILLFFLLIYLSMKIDFSFLSDTNFLKIFSFILFIFIIYDFISLNLNSNLKIFYEPSHVALYLSPFLFLSLKKKVMLILNSINLIYLFYFQLSLTLLIIFILFMSLSNLKKNYIILVIGIIIISFTNYDNPTIIKLFNSFDTIYNVFKYGIIDLDVPYTFSIAVWLNGFSNIFIYLKQTFFLGAGFNLMGCQEYFYNGSFNYLFLDYGKHDVYNANDGSFNLSKIISENGLLGLIVLFFVLIKIIKDFLNKPNDLLFIGSIMLFTFLIVRGLNYFSLPFVITTIMVLKHNLKQTKK